MCFHCYLKITETVSSNPIPARLGFLCGWYSIEFCPFNTIFLLPVIFYCFFPMIYNSFYLLYFDMHIYFTDLFSLAVTDWIGWRLLSKHSFIQRTYYYSETICQKLLLILEMHQWTKHRKMSPLWKKLNFYARRKALRKQKRYIYLLHSILECAKHYRSTNEQSNVANQSHQESDTGEEGQ